MGKSDGRMYVLYMFDILPLVFVCQITPPLPSIKMWAGNDPDEISMKKYNFLLQKEKEVSKTDRFFK